MVSRPAQPRVAVTGIGCRAFGANSPDRLWESLTSEEPLPQLALDRWDPAVYSAELPDGMNASLRGAPIDDYAIDWREFRLPPISTERMHRMERAALGAMNAALRDAGVGPDDRVGAGARVYVAATSLGPDPLTDHARRIRRFELQSPISRALARFAPDDQEDVDEFIAQLFNLAAPPIEPDSMQTSASMIAARITNLYDFRGGHMCIDAGASSSLVALAQASRVLTLGDADLVVVCGLSPLIEPASLLSFAHRGYLGAASPQPYHPDASGTTLGEAAIAVVLTREEDADPSECLAFIEGVATTLGPRGGRTVSDPVDRAARKALGQAGCGPADVAVVATRAGGIADDEGERAGLGAAYWGRARRDPLWLSSHVESVGNVQAAGGLMSLAHAVLALGRGAWSGGSLVDARTGAPSSSTPELDPEARIGVSDAGMCEVAGHLIVAGARSTIVSRGRPRSRQDDAVVIVGMGAVAPRAPDSRTLWRNTLEGIDAIGDLPASRWDPNELIDASPEMGPILKTRLAGAVRVPVVDPRHYQLPLAGPIDPAVLLALVATEEALLDAGILQSVNPDRVQVILGQLPVRLNEVEADKRALFAGHLHLSAQAMQEAGLEGDQIEQILAAAREDFDARSHRFDEESFFARSSLTVAAQVAAAFGLKGGAMAVDAACASSLAALDLAADSLLLGEADAAVAGGVAFNLIPEYYMLLSMLGALSPTGAPPFEIGADGFVPGEGAGVVVLRRLSDARERGETIWAVVRGIGSSSDGRGTSVYAPSTEGQVSAIRRAHAAAHVTPVDIDLLEAHGGGTSLGDSTEIQSYASVYGAATRHAPLVVGTLKSQIGHLSAAAGAVGLLKAAHALRDHEFAPSRSVAPKGDLPFGNNLDLGSQRRRWPASGDHRRHAAVSAFGLGGINYHVILEEAPDIETEVAVKPLVPVVLPTRGARADRFVVRLVPVALPGRDAPVSLDQKRVIVIAEEPDATLASALQRCGAVVEHRQPAALTATIAKGADGFIDLRARQRAAADVDLRALIERSEVVACETLEILQAALEALEAGAFYAAVTARGGELGLFGSTEGDVCGAQLAGWLKALKREIPAARPKVLDFELDATDEEVSSVLLDELQDGNDRVEAGWLGRRVVEAFARTSFEPDEIATRPLRKGDVWLFSGGGRGVTFECAVALAQQGGRVIVTGRTELPESGAAWLDLDDEAFEETRKNALELARANDSTLTPVRFQAQFSRRERQREVHQNLRRARALGLDLEYRVCDITDADAVSDLVAQVKADYERVDGVVHGAMVEFSRGLARKTREQLELTFRAKVDGLVNLLEATRDEPLHSFIAFGSGAGRFGNRGQADYAAANALMAAMVTQQSRLRPACHMTTINWTAWQEVGAAAANPDIAALVKRTGVTAIRPSEGIYWFLGELTAGDADEVVIFEERMLHTWPGMGSRAEGDGERSVRLDDRGQPLVPGEWPMIDRVISSELNSLRCARVLDLERDHFLSQHRLNDVPIVPATFGVELLAEAAALGAPGWEVDEIVDLIIDEPVKLHRGAPLSLRATATAVSSGERRELLVETHSHLFLKGRPLKRDRLHHRGTVFLRRPSEAPPARVEIPSLDGIAKSRSYFHLAKDPVGLGPIFSTPQWIIVGDELVTGEIRPPRMRDLVSTSSAPRFCVDPLVLDAAFQIAANWDGYRNGFVSIPLGLGRLALGRARRLDEFARVVARVVRVEDPEVHYDLDVVGENDELLLRVNGLRLHRVGPLVDV